MKKILLLTAVIFFLAAESLAAAHELFWYDRNAGFNNFSKVVVFPLSNVWDAPFDYQLGEEGTRNFRLNSYLDERLTKKFKKINFIRLADEIKSAADIATNPLGRLLEPFDSEQERAKAVRELTGADMYIVPGFRENDVHEDISPSREWNVELKSWTEETGAPYGDRTYGQVYHTVHHVIPEKTVYLHLMQLEFTGYDKNGNVIFTSLHHDQSYSNGEEAQFNKLVNDFQKIFVSSRKKSKDKKVRNKELLELKPAIIDGEAAGDLHLSKAFDFALRVAALDKIKKVAVNLNPAQASNYYVQSEVTDFELKSYWNEPTYYVNDKLVSSNSRNWKDKDGKEHTMNIRSYRQEISDSYAHWSFYWAVNVKFSLCDSKGNVLYTQIYRESDDKPADAYRHAADKFCKEVNKYFKG